MSYDQWKTASPFDDDPDPIDDGEGFLKRHKEYLEGRQSIHLDVMPQEFDQACELIKELLQYIDDNI